MYLFLQILMLLCCVTTVFADDQAAIDVPYFPEAEIDIKIDGAIREAIWNRAPFHGGLASTFPDSGEPGRWQTRVRFIQSEQGLYVAFWNEQPADSLLARITSRDSFASRDGVELVIDSSGEGLYGYWFGVSLGDALGDGIALPERWFEKNWDGPWQGATQVVADGWTAEMFLPWSMMSMPKSADGVRQMGISIHRYLGKANEVWSMPYLPPTQPRYMSALRTIKLTGVNPTQQYSVYPYLAATYDAEAATSDTNAGVDLFWRPATSLQLSATLNPDFGHVESDNIVVNFTAFETFFPEKRLFFLENQDVFRWGVGNTSPLLHTRRIGSSISSRRGAPDDGPGVSFEAGSVGAPVDLLGAVKVAGQSGPWRYGVLAAAEGDTDVKLSGGGKVILPGREFVAVRVARDQSGGDARRSIGWLGTITDHPNRRALTQGYDATYQSPDGKLRVTGLLALSHINEDAQSPDQHNETGIGGSVHFNIAPRQGSRHGLSIGQTDRHLDTNDLGFLNRNDLIHAFYSYSHNANREAGRFRQVNTSLNLNGNWNNDERMIGAGLGVSRGWVFRNNTSINASFSFNPGAWDDRNAFGDGSFRREPKVGIRLNWAGDWGRPLVFAASANLSQDRRFGLSEGVSGQLVWRPNDYINLNLQLDYNAQDEWLLYSGDDRFTSYEYRQLRPRLRFDSFLSARQQLSLELQWVGLKAVEFEYWKLLADGGLSRLGRAPAQPREGFAISSLTMQVRYRWQIAPLSDLWVVYSHGGDADAPSIDDGYAALFSEALRDPDQRILVAKLRYRLGS
jgi:hypothetical protein